MGALETRQRRGGPWGRALGYAEIPAPPGRSAVPSACPPEGAAMLNKLDDFPIHQTPEPVAHPATSDRNAYDRTWFNGYANDGSYYFGIGSIRTAESSTAPSAW